jgi:hypothetical protein
VHTIAALAPPDSLAFDFSTAVETSGPLLMPTEGPVYRVRVCGSDPVVTAGPM